ncbi:Uma2 family endonuclease [Archangium primigenium]|nr:Uma2 family endonuclease [Archangium primigenium]MBM7113595.1 Uma2 family endonuclease [Archangium primigenium]
MMGWGSTTKVTPPGPDEALLARLEALPPHVVGEILAGQLIVSPRPASPHSAANFALAGALGGPFQRDRPGPEGWWFFAEPELRLGPDVVVPDLAGWRRSRMPVRRPVPNFTLAPDWVCEVLSPSTARIDRTLKKRFYAREGVEYVWLVDPVARTLEVLRRHEDPWLERGAWSGDARVRAEPFDALELELKRFWFSESPEPE